MIVNEVTKSEEYFNLILRLKFYFKIVMKDILNKYHCRYSKILTLM